MNQIQLSNFEQLKNRSNIFSFLAVITIFSLLSKEVTLIFSASIMLLSVIFLIGDNKNNVILTLFYLIIFQNFLVSLLISRGYFINIAITFDYWKELYLISIILISSINLDRNFRIMFIDLLVMMLAIYLLVLFFLYNSSDKIAELHSLRQILLPSLLYIAGRLIAYKKEIDYKIIVNHLFYIATSIAIFGIFESYVYKDLWKDLNTFSYFLYKQGEYFKQAAIDNPIPLNFVTYDFATFFGSYVRRIASFLLNPPVLGHLMAYFSILFIYLRKDFLGYSFKYNLAISLMIFTTIFTLGKGGIITLFIGIFYYVFFVLKNKKVLFFSNLMLLIAFFFTIGYLIFAVVNNLSGLKHIYGLLNSFTETDNVFGHGLGSGGNIAAKFTGKSEVEESFLGLVFYQTGIFGTILFSFLYISILIIGLKLSKQIKTNFEKMLFIATIVNIFSNFIVSFVTESAISFTSIGIQFIILGSIFTKILLNNKK